MSTATLALLLAAPAACLVALLPAARGAGASPLLSATRSVSGLDRSVGLLDSTGGVVLIDAENVRGKSGFRLAHDELLAATAQWTNDRGLRGRVVLVVDHGEAHQGFYLRDKGLAVIFAGPSQKADDVLARDVGYFSAVQRRDAIVVTADAGLRKRCRAKAHSARRLHLVQPSRFIESLFHSASEAVDPPDGVGALVTDAQLAAELAQLEAKLAVTRSTSKRAKLQRQRERLAARAAAAAELEGAEPGAERGAEPAEGALVEGASAAAAAAAAAEGGVLSAGELGALSSGVRSLREAGMGGRSGDGGVLGFSRREKTWEREAMAESLRGSLLEMQAGVQAEMEADLAEEAAAPPAGTAAAGGAAAADYVTWINAAVGLNGAPPAWLRQTRLAAGMARPVKCADAADVSVAEVAFGVLGGLRIEMAGGGAAAEAEAAAEPLAAKPVRVVIVSDTHGYERSLTGEAGAGEGGADGANGGTLPAGDVLIHCGDWAIEGSSGARLQAALRFDEWLAQQPCVTRVVVRGNHDPVHATFPASGARHVVRPATLQVGGITIGVVPFSRGRLREPLPPCDILVTHVPPKGVLDRCYNGDNAGSRVLRDAVCESLIKPRAWLAGHIHEGRGYESVQFGQAVPPTLVINAACANSGKANKLVAGPIVLELAPTRGTPSDRLSGGAEGGAEGANVPLAERRLLAVDLGLRTGVALYDGKGRLLEYAMHHVAGAVELADLAEGILRGGPLAAPGGGVPSRAAPLAGPAVTHVAIEGRDVGLRDEWHAAAARAAATAAGGGGRLASVVQVSPEAWRRELMLPKERRSGGAAKVVARQIARQVVAERGADGAHEGKFATDAAEAVLVGYYTLRQLGWCSRDGPAVRRYQNGAVMK